MKTILITGSNGLLGQKLVCALYRDHGYRVIATSFSPNRMDDEGYEFELMDVTNKIEVDYMFDKYHPDVAIHTAAMTQVDTCEKKRTECWQTNVESVKILLENARKHNTHLIHLSSDFVFDGTNGPYSEEDTLNPLNYYGLSKQESEKLVMKYTGPWSIIRTSLVYGVNPSLARPNIVLWLRYAL
ncbi:MAG: sugar nucleotide-binding protein, partial [Bacteroidales bacterium]|nr:sugar nucleotide-binding protein [Bacteroidales bacterium]